MPVSLMANSWLLEWNTNCRKIHFMILHLKVFKIQVVDLKSVAKKKIKIKNTFIAEEWSKKLQKIVKPLKIFYWRNFTVFYILIPLKNKKCFFFRLRLTIELAHTCPLKLIRQERKWCKCKTFNGGKYPF